MRTVTNSWLVRRPGPTLPTSAAPSLASAFNPRSNSIGFLRFAFAGAVLLNHTFILGGWGSDDALMFWSHGQISFASMAVDGFFVISGYLITHSYASSPSVARYLWRRFIRIFPAFWICLLITAFICAPIVLLRERGTLTGANWSGDQSPVTYVLRNAHLSIKQFNIWDLLASVPQTRMAANFGVDPGAIAFDRSLWTLRYEFDAYLLVAAAGIIGVLARLRVASVVWAIFLAVNLILYGVTTSYAAQLPRNVVFAFLLDYQFLRLSYMFALGAVMYVYRQRVPMGRLHGGVALAVLIGTLIFGGYEVVGRIAFAYVCMWLAVYLPIREFDRRGDYSYGLYIYGWLVAQMLAVFSVYQLGIVPYYTISIVGSFALAFLSWHLIEAPALRLKSIDPPHFLLPVQMRVSSAAKYVSASLSTVLR